MHENTQIAFHEELEKIAVQWRFNAEQKKQMHDEVRDPRFYSNLRGMLSLESKEKRVKAHEKLSPGVRDSKWQAAKEGITRSKEAGIGSFLSGGYKVLSRVAGGKASLGGLKRLGTMAYRQGAAGGGGVMGGLKGLAKSQVGQAAGAVAAPLAAGYGLHKMTSD
jgi:hypothetical protein